MLRIAEDIEINNLPSITVEGIIHRLLGQVDHRLAQPAEKSLDHAAVARL